MNALTVRAAVLLATILLLIGAIAASAKADADPHTQVDDLVSTIYADQHADAICSTLDAYPSVPGLIGVLEGVRNHGHLTDLQVGEAVGIAVHYRCPRHIALLRDFVAMRTSAPHAPRVTA